MKTLLLSITLFASLFVISCKKEKNTVESPKNFDELKMGDIQVKESQMSDKGLNGNTAVFKTNDVYIFKTNANLFGKFKILSVGPATDYKLTISATVYNTDGTIKQLNSALVLSLAASTTFIDLDTFNPLIYGDNRIDLWWWNISQEPRLALYTTNGAKMLLYNF